MEENVRVDSAELNRLREWTKENKYKLGGYVSKLIKAHMDKVDKRKALKRTG